MRTSYHPTCTFKMGRDTMSVVDPELRIAWSGMASYL
ncbi:GMC oxidoreductase [Komagataeibacter saccharivorans]|nr:GMC oxidoreductase [Komagataeibacter saccharivorans]